MGKYAIEVTTITTTEGYVYVEAPDPETAATIARNLTDNDEVTFSEPKGESMSSPPIPVAEWPQRSRYFDGRYHDGNEWHEVPEATDGTS